MGALENEKEPKLNVTQYDRFRKCLKNFYL